MSDFFNLIALSETSSVSQLAIEQQGVSTTLVIEYEDGTTKKSSVPPVEIKTEISTIKEIELLTVAQQGAAGVSPELRYECVRVLDGVATFSARPLTVAEVVFNAEDGDVIENILTQGEESFIVAPYIFEKRANELLTGVDFNDLFILAKVY